METEEKPKEVEQQTLQPTLLEDTYKAIAELKALNAEKKALLDREEKLRAVEALGGHSEAGTTLPPQKSEQEIKDDDFIKTVMGAVGRKPSEE